MFAALAACMHVGDVPVLALSPETPNLNLWPLTFIRAGFSKRICKTKQYKQNCVQLCEGGLSLAKTKASIDRLNTQKEVMTEHMFSVKRVNLLL